MDARKSDCLLDVDRSLLSKSAGLIGRLAADLHLLWQFVESPEGVALEEEQEVGEVAWCAAGCLQHHTSSMAVGVCIGQHACSCLQVWREEEEEVYGGGGGKLQEDQLLEE